ncbi:hypothetical protein, partial [Pectobacterium aroidearum]
RQGYRELIERFGSSEDAAIQLQVARTMLKLAFGLDEGDAELCKKIIEKFRTSKDGDILLVVATAQIMLSNKLLNEEKNKDISDIINDFNSLSSYIGERSEYRELKSYAMFIEGLNKSN